eukprot:COSAG05_NODE_3238_length_2215_cov_1.879547_2_plen_43_part_00
MTEDLMVRTLPSGRSETHIFEGCEDISVFSRIVWFHGSTVPP